MGAWSMRLRFQFHKGTIRTCLLSLLIWQLRNFNSIKVQLEQSSLTQISRGFSYFNSIKVQLEHLSLNAFDNLDSHFNSIKVQLERALS